MLDRGVCPKSTLSSIKAAHLNCLTFKAHQVQSMYVAFKLKLTLSMKISFKCHHNIIPYFSLCVRPLTRG